MLPSVARKRDIGLPVAIEVALPENTPSFGGSSAYADSRLNRRVGPHEPHRNSDADVLK